MSESNEKNKSAPPTGDPETPLSLKIISGFCGLFLIIIGGVILFVPYTRSERVQGRVESEPGVIKIAADMDSVVLRQYVAEGDVIHKGQPLLTLSIERQLGTKGGAQIALGKQSDLKASTLRQEMANVQSLYDSEQSLLNSQISRKQDEVLQIKANINIQERLYNLTKDNYKRQEDLVDKGFISKVGLAEEEQKLLLAESTYEAAKKDLISAQAEMDELQANKATLVRRREKELYPLTRELSTTRQEAIDYEAKQEFVILSPSDGVVAAILPNVGDTVLEKDLLISISPKNAEFFVSLYVPSSAIGFLQKKNPVVLRYESYPYQTFGEYKGLVKSISPVALDGSELKLSLPSTDSYYRVQVALESQKAHAYGREFSLHDGIKVEGDIKVETRKVFEWVLDPFYAKFYGK